jgi:hypothetical protein
MSDFGNIQLKEKESLPHFESKNIKFFVDRRRGYMVITSFCQTRCGGGWRKDGVMMIPENVYGFLIKQMNLSLDTGARDDRPRP